MSFANAKQTLVSAGQLFGSGKSYLGRLATTGLRDSVDLTKFEFYKGILHREKFHKKNLFDAYLESVYILINFQDFAPGEFGTLSEMVARLLFASMSMFSILLKNQHKNCIS